MSNILRTVLTQPLFNLLIIIYAIIPGNDFGIALIIFTIIVRLALWPLLKKQLHSQKAIRDLQPEIAKIKQRAKGDRAKISQLTMELYKEREINPLGSLGVLIIQLPILIALFLMIRSVVDDHTTVEKLAYGVASSLEPVKEIIKSPEAFKPELLGFLDLSKQAVSRTADGLAFYWTAVPLAILAGLGQFMQTKQLSASREKGKTLRELLKDAKDGKEVNQAEQQAAMTGSMTYIFPFITLFVSLGFPAALSLYWAANSLIAVVQQRMILEQDLEEMAQVSEKPTKTKLPRKVSTPGASKKKKKSKKAGK